MGASSAITKPAKSATKKAAIAAQPVPPVVLRRTDLQVQAEPFDRSKYVAHLAQTFPPASVGGNSPLSTLADAYDAAWEARNIHHVGDLPHDDPLVTAVLDARHAVEAYSPTTVAELHEKVAILRSPRFNEHEDDTFQAAEVINADALRLLGPPKGPEPERAAWDAAVAAYEALKRQHDQLTQKGAASFSAHLQKFFEPALLRPSMHYPLHMRWHGAADLENDPTLTPEARVRFGPAVETARAAWEAEPEADGDDDGEELYDRVCDAEAVVLSLPAPDLEAAIYKAVLLGRESDDDKRGLECPGRVSFLLHHYYVDRQAPSLLLDLVRLNDPHHPLLRAADFDPSAWIAAYEAAGGKVGGVRGGLVLSDPDEKPEGFEMPEAWQWYAIYLAADARRERGGDPIFDSSGRCGRQDRRARRRAVQQIASGVRVHFHVGAAELQVFTERFITGDEVFVESACWRENRMTDFKVPATHCDHLRQARSPAEASDLAGAVQ